MDDQGIDNSVSGDFVSESLEFGGGRQVTVYVPPEPPEAVVFAGDGQLTSRLGRASRNSRCPLDDDRRRSPADR